MDEKRSGASYHDEPGDDVGEEAAYDHIKARGGVVLDADALFYDGRLQVKLHPRRDGRPHHADGHVDIVGGPGRALRHPDSGHRCLAPIGLREHAVKDVSDINHRGNEKYLLDLLVISADNKKPDEHRTDRHRDEFRHMEEVQAARDADEFRNDVGVVHQHQQHHHHDCHAQAEFLANQIAEPLARDHAHTSAHLLDHDQRQGNWNHRP